jgi:peptidoglycan/LPS O-acetylase OafA/YrhL
MRIKKLDGLRGIFSVMVVLFHYRILNNSITPELLRSGFVVRQSEVFVDFFFVLSGFVIAYNYSIIPSFKKFIEFMKKRFVRLFPLLFYTCAVFLVLLLSVDILKSNFGFFENSESMSAGVLGIHFLDAILFTNSTPLLGSEAVMNPPSWSISSEMISYGVFGVVTLVCSSFSRKVVNVLIVISSFVFLFYLDDYFTHGEFGFVRGLLCFNVGFFVYNFSKRSFELPKILEILCFVILIVIMFAINHFQETPYYNFIALFSLPLFFGMFILVFLKTNGLISKILENRFFQFLGKISFSIYLNHVLVLFIFPKMFFKVFGIEQNVLMEYLVYVITLVLVIGYSKLTHQYIELKLGKKLKSLLIHNS